MSIASLGYIGLSVTDISAWQHYATNILGLSEYQHRESHASSAFFKMDEHPYRLMVTAASEDKLQCAGWEVTDKQAMQALVEKLKANGNTVTYGDDAGAKLRCVTEFVCSKDPAGNPFEIYYGRTRMGEPFNSPLDIGKFVTGDMGMGHVVIPAPNIEEVHDFYVNLLGFGDSDDLHLPPPAEGAPSQRIVFMHADNPRHHSLALYNFPVPSGIVHMIFEVTSIDEVGACLDRVTQAKIPLMANLGRHCNDNMLSFYMFGPGGICVEYGYDGKQIDWQNFEPTVSTQGDFWGHAYQVQEVLNN